MEAARGGEYVIPKNIHPEQLNEFMRGLSKYDAYWDSQKRSDPSITFYELLARYLEHVVPNYVGKKNLEQLAATARTPLKHLMYAFAYAHSFNMLCSTNEFKALREAYVRTFCMLGGFVDEDGNTDKAVRMYIANNVMLQFIALFAHLEWENEGKKTYVVSPKLAEGLRITHLKKFKADQLKLPHPGVYVSFPPGMFTMNIVNIGLSDADPVTLGGLSVNGAYIIEDPNPQDMRMWRMVVVCDDSRTSTIGAAQIFHYYMPLFDDKSVDECVDFSIDVMKGKAHFEYTVPLISGGTYTGTFDHVDTRQTPPEVLKSAKEVFEFLMNTVLYITNSEVDAVLRDANPEYDALRKRMLDATGGKREKLKDRLRDFTPRPVIVLGGNYTIKRGDTAAEGTDEEGRSWKMKVRTLVGGHWRNQACGVGHLDRKHIWIQPHWRGPEAAPITEKRAIVK